MAHCVNRSSPEFKALAEQSNINPIILAAKVSLWQEKNGLDNFPNIEDLVLIEPDVQQLFDPNNVEGRLKSFFDQFGFQYKEGDLSTDLLNKIIYVNRNDSSLFINNSVKALSQLLLANTNVDFNVLEKLIEDTPEFKKMLSESSDYVKSTHKFLKDGNRIPMEEWVSYIKDYNNIKNTVLEKYIKESILDENNSTELHKLIKNFMEWFKDLFTNAKQLKDVTDSLIQQVLLNKKDVVINSKDLLNKERVTLNKALEETLHGKDIIKTFGDFGLILTGSVSAAEQGSVFRKVGKLLHDIDWVVPKGFNKDFNKKLKETFPGATLVREFDSSTYYTHTYIVPPKGYTISNLTFFKPEVYGKNKYIASYDVLDSYGDVVSNYRRYYDVKPSGKVIENREVYNEGLQYVDKNLEAVSVDFFENKEELKYPPHVVNIEGVNLQLSNWLSSFTEKLKYGRAKDLLDYANFIPNDRVSNNSILLQSEDMAASKASEETVAIMRQAAEQMGIDIQDLLDYAKANPEIDVKNVNGLADIIKGAVAIAQGKEGVALVEEIVHITTAILEQTDPKFITELISKIDRFKIYKQVLAVYSKKKEYQLANGKPNIRKIKKEAVDKLISEVVIYQSEGSTEYPELMEEETRNMIQKLWEMILDKLRGVYRKSNIDIFQTAGTIVKSGKAGTVADIKTDGIYFQVDDSVTNKITDFWNKAKEYSKDMILHPEIKDAQGNITQKRHYTFKGEKVATTITEKIKKNKKFPERTPEQQAVDDEKKDWGDAGHLFQQQDLETNFIDKTTGFAYAQPLNNRIDSKLPFDLQKKLHNFNKELIASYPPGTRFLIEEKVINLKEKGMIGSTVDFKAIYPAQKKDGSWDMKIDNLDWKFTTVDKTRYDDISRDKIKDWVPQMGQFVAIDYTYGANQNQIGKARMIPFIMNYNYRIAGDKKSGLVPESIEIGKLDSLKETNLYLLPVPILSETTGNEQVDKLINSLQSQWDKLYSKPVTFEGKDKRIADLSELSKAIRFLHLKLDFEPLVNVGKTFLNNAADVLKDFKNIKFAELNEVELNKKLEDLIAYEEGAKKYSDLDEAFLSYYPRKELNSEGQKIVNDLTNIGRATENMLKEIKDLQKQFVVEIALREKFTTEDTQLSVLDAEATISGIEKSFAEGSKLSSKLINLATNFIMVAKKVVDGKIRKQIKQFGELIVPLEQEAKAKGVKAFDMIATKSDKGLSLIKKINPEFWKKVNKAKEDKNKQFFLDNLNLDEYNALAKTAIEQRISDASKRQYASDPETNERYKEYAIEAVKNALDITSDSFNGYNDRTFGYLFNKSFKEEKNYSKEYLEMSKSKAALDVWNFFTNLNKRAESMGYIGEHQDSFFPLMEATILEKFYQTSNIGFQTKDFFQDFYKIKVNEEQQFSKLDPETGKVKKIIPKFFTRTDKAVEQLSTDLNKVGSLWIKSLEEYESKKNLESVLTTLHSVEKAKGSLIVENGKVVFENRIPKTNDSENKNADLLQVIIDDELYGLRENQSSLGNIAISALSSKLGKTEEGVEKFEVGTKKVIATADTWVQSLAVGLKPAIGIANWFGNQFLAFIQAGGFYNFWTDFEKNNVRVCTGQMSTIERGLLDLIHPLNEDVTEEERRSLAWKQGFTKYLSTWSFTDVMQITNSFPERKLQYANALSFIDNSIVIDGEIRNIRKYLKEQDRKTKYNLSVSERKSLESTFENRVTELKKAPNALKNIAKIENGEVVIPGVSDLNIAKFSLQVSEYGRTLNGQMSLTNKADYRRDTMFSSFMMFKNWIPKLVTARGMDIKKNVELDTWEYGRTRAFFKTVAFLGKSNITSMIDIINGTEKGLKILDELLEAKKIEHYKKTGQELEITQEEFYDLMREQLVNQSKEFALLFGTLALVLAAAAAEPPEDATDAEKNAYKWYSKLINKISDEVSFYYNPISFESITKGSLLPSVGLLSKGLKIVQQLSLEGYGMATDDEEMMKKAHALKYAFNIVPGLSQLQNEVLPYLYPELAKEQGIRVTGESRRQ
jgi:hypothetical protein